MNDKVKEIFTPSLHGALTQVAPYIVEFDDTAMFTHSYLYDMAKATGSTFKYITESKNGKSLYRISDPLCKILENTGMNS